MRLVDPRALGLIVAGGAIGAGLRAVITLPFSASDIESLATLAAVTTGINIVGSLLLGVVVGWLDDRRPYARTFLGTGVLGGFTTYSAFAVHVVVLGSTRGMAASAAGFGWTPGPATAAVVVAASVLGGLIAAIVGLWIGRRIADVPGEIEPVEDAE